MAKVDKYAEFAKSLDCILKSEDSMLEIAKKLILEENEKRYVTAANKRFVEFYNEKLQRRELYKATIENFMEVAQ